MRRRWWRRKLSKSNPSVTVSGAENIINKSTVDAILETGLVQDVYLESQLGYSCVAPFAEDNADMEYDESRMIRNVTYYGLNQPEAYCARNGIEITYAPGWDNGFSRKNGLRIMYTRSGFQWYCRQICLLS